MKFSLPLKGAPSICIDVSSLEQFKKKGIMSSGGEGGANMDRERIRTKNALLPKFSYS